MEIGTLPPDRCAALHAFRAGSGDPPRGVEVHRHPDAVAGPDYASNCDNRANLKGFQHEGDQFFAWLKLRNIRNVILLTGDRHWQYHSIHPSGVPRFACDSLHREVGVGDPPVPGRVGSFDPEGLIVQKFATKEAEGGFLRVVVEADAGLRVELINQGDEILHVHQALPLQ